MVNATLHPLIKAQLDTGFEESLNGNPQLTAMGTFNNLAGVPTNFDHAAAVLNSPAP